MRSPLRRAFDVAAVFIVALYLAPIYWVVLTSIKPTIAINSAKPVWSFEPTWEHYREAFVRFEFDRALLNSAIIVLSATFITMVLALFSSYALARMKIKGADFMSLTILSLRFMPGVVIAMPFFLMFQRLDMIDTHVGMIIIYVGFGLPFAVWLLRGFMMDIPRDVEEAARLDGLGWISIIWRIILPMSGPGIAVTAIFTFVFDWNEFLFALYITQATAVTLPIQISKMIDLYNVLWGTISGAVVMQLVPMVIVVFLLQRHMIRGLALGAVK
ncbi:MAG: carbohydrate ABC transporter permease [Alphaproteobacteria bacterium]|nr:carbohydrate ABC transporter permease [Alphaproteobacteria bacterium]